MQHEEELRGAIVEAVVEHFGAAESAQALALAIAEKVVESTGDRVLLAIEVGNAHAAGFARHLADDAAAKTIAAISEKMDSAIEENCSRVEALADLVAARMDTDTATWASRLFDLVVEVDELRAALADGPPGLFDDVIETLDRVSAFGSSTRDYIVNRLAMLAPTPGI